MSARTQRNRRKRIEARRRPRRSPAIILSNQPLTKAQATAIHDYFNRLASKALIPTTS
jgi:hypothetical protein